MAASVWQVQALPTVASKVWSQSQRQKKTFILSFPKAVGQSLFATFVKMIFNIMGHLNVLE
jgi:hypothetical protein